MSKITSVTREQLETLRDRYLELIKEEVELFGVQPTELRALVGRLGEIECVRRVNGSFPEAVNQHGYDVICSKGRRISVKTTAVRDEEMHQPIKFNLKTIDQVDDVMVLRFKNGALETLYYGPVEKVVGISTKDGWVGLRRLSKLVGY